MDLQAGVRDFRGDAIEPTAYARDFFLEAVSRDPLRPPKGIPRTGGKIFRVDAKAEGATVVIGGWETHGGTVPSESRWFSVRLTRKNALCVFVKGEPFKVIASLELLAITVAIMVFEPEAKWKGMAGRLSLTAFTDNQANSYVLDKYMSTAFPLSVVLIELALHLQRSQVDLDLQWIPRDQNVEADALTNEEFGDFNADLRLPVEIEELKFLVLHQLIKFAEEIDSEITMKKASKEKTPRQDATKKMRLTQPWWSFGGVRHHQDDVSAPPWKVAAGGGDSERERTETFSVKGSMNGTRMFQIVSVRCLTDCGSSRHFGYPPPHPQSGVRHHQDVSAPPWKVAAGGGDSERERTETTCSEASHDGFQFFSSFSCCFGAVEIINRR